MSLLRMRFHRVTALVVLFASLPAGPVGAADARKPVVIPAADLAPPNVRSEQPGPGKWWLRRGVEGVPGGAILMTGQVAEGEVPKEKLTLFGVVPAELYATPHRVPALEIDPKVKGWYRISVGLFNRPEPTEHYLLPPRLWGRLSGEPYPEYLMAPQGARESVVETEWRVADLTGQTLRLEQPPASMMFPGHGWLGGVSHIRLTPLDDAEVGAARRREELPPAGHRLFAMLDTTDEIFWWGNAETADDIKAIVWRHERAGFGRIYLRCWGTHLDNSHAVMEANPRWTDADEAAYIKSNGTKAGWRPLLDLPNKFDFLKVASDYGKERGVEVHGWIRLTNFNRAPYAEFWHQHPEYRLQRLSKDGKSLEPYPRVLSFAHPEVRAFYVKFCKQIASTGTPGLLVDLLRHPPLAGLEPASAERFKKKFGVELASRIKPGEDPMRALISDPMVNDHQADLLEEFLRELRKEVGPAFAIGVRSSGPSKFGLRGKAWIESGLIQTIVDGNWYSGNGPRPTAGDTVAAAGTKGHAYAVAEPGNVDPKTWGKRPGTLEADAILALAQHYQTKGVHRFGVYESTEFVWRPELRRAIRQAGWLFAEKGDK